MKARTQTNVRASAVCLTLLAAVAATTGVLGATATRYPSTAMASTSTSHSGLTRDATSTSVAAG
jgi:hypothetical protein